MVGAAAWARSTSQGYQMRFTGTLTPFPPFSRGRCPFLPDSNSTVARPLMPDLRAYVPTYDLKLRANNGCVTNLPQPRAMTSLDADFRSRAALRVETAGSQPTVTQKRHSGLKVSHVEPMTRLSFDACSLHAAETVATIRTAPDTPDDERLHNWLEIRCRWEAERLAESRIRGGWLH